VLLLIATTQCPWLPWLRRLLVVVYAAAAARRGLLPVELRRLFGVVYVAGDDGEWIDEITFCSMQDVIFC
jgi:hypothetical protein